MELNSFYRSPNIVRMIKSRRLRWAGHVARIEEGRTAFTILRGKRHSKRPRRRWKDNIRMARKGISINTRNWVDLAEDRNYCRVLVNLRVPYAMEIVSYFQFYSDVNKFKT